MKAVRSSEKVLVCETCGDEGFKNAFVYCVNCLDAAIHRYCLNVIPKTFIERVNWCCEFCKVKSSQSQEKEVKISGQKVSINLKKKQEKGNDFANVKAWTNIVYCQGNITDPECEHIDLRKWLFLHHIPKKKRSNRKNIVVCEHDKSFSGFSRMEIELDKTSNHERQDESATNVSQSDFVNNIQESCDKHTQLVIDPVWRYLRHHLLLERES